MSKLWASHYITMALFWFVIGAINIIISIKYYQFNSILFWFSTLVIVCNFILFFAYIKLHKINKTTEIELERLISDLKKHHK